MRKLNVKEIKFGGDTYHVSRLTEVDSIPEYGVILDNGLLVDCSFGGHIFCYAIAATIYLAENFNGVIPGRQDKLTGEELFANFNEVIKNGVISEEDSVELVSSFSAMGSITAIRSEEKWPELASVVNGATFINSRAEVSTPSVVVKEFCENWITKYGDYIWAVRVLSYMLTDPDFFIENDKGEWDKIYAERIGGRLPSLVKFLNMPTSAYYERYVYPDFMADTLPKDKREVLNMVIDTYPTIRAMYGVEAWYGSLWQENFYTDDLDHFVFAKPTKSKPICDSGKYLRDMEEGSVTIADGYANFVVTVDRSAISNITFSVTDTDEYYFDFIAPQNLALRQFYEAGELVRNYCVDKYVKVTLNEK